MDSIVGSSIVTPAGGDGTPGAAGSLAEALIYTFVAMVVLRVEFQRRAGAGPGAGHWQLLPSADSAKRLLKENAAEAALLISCVALAVLMRSRGDVSSELGTDEHWEQIKNDWPLLMTADSLLSLQAMARLVAFTSAMLRCRGPSAAPLSGDTTVVWFFAGLARLALCLRTDSYALDGPLGGLLPVAFEIAALPVLLVLSWRALLRSPLPKALVLTAVGYYAWHNRLALADGGDAISDFCFAAAQSLELLAAFVYLARVALVEGAAHCPGVGFAHVLMLAQQAVGAYYWLEAFSPSQELVGAGRPFDVLHIGTSAALGAYIAAAALGLAERLDGEAAGTA